MIDGRIFNQPWMAHPPMVELLINHGWSIHDINSYMSIYSRVDLDSRFRKTKPIRYFKHSLPITRCWQKFANILSLASKFFHHIFILILASYFHFDVL